MAKEKQENAENLENRILLDYQNQMNDYINVDGSRKELELNFNNYKICSLIPNMTSNKTPSGVVEANDYYTGRDPFHAFEGNMPNASYGTGYWFSLYNNSWLSYTWEDEVLIGCIDFYKKTENEFKIQYLNNDIWIDIGTVPKISSNNIFEEVTVFFPNIVKTKAIRFYCTYIQAENAAGGCALGNIRAYGIEKVK